MKKELTQIATEVRNQCVEFAFSSEAKGYDFYKKSDLRCMCAVASFQLFSVLKKNKFDPSFHVGIFDTMEYFWVDENGHERNSPSFGYEKKSSNHCWIEVEDYLIDITVTQFNEYFKNIIFRPVSIFTLNNEEFDYYYSLHQLSTSTSILHYLRKIDWDSNQLPSLNLF